MSDAEWDPLSYRIAGRSLHAGFHEGIPEHLSGYIEDWAHERRGDGDDRLLWRLPLRLQIPFRVELESYDVEQLLDILDGILYWYPREHADNEELLNKWPGEVDRLDSYLELGRSIWRVNASRDGLERRIDATITAAAVVTIHEAPDQAADHLRAAWSALYGRHPDPDRAYREAVLAVEAVACPLVLPHASTPTLGAVRSHLRDAASKWELVLPGGDSRPATIESVVAMLTVLWEGQRSRHAGSRNSRRQTPEEAQAAVHLSATLVRWFDTGVIHRKPIS